MGITKTDLFTVSQNEMASIAKVFAHPARIAIMEHLIKSNACINSDLVLELGLAQATISQHLKELKNIGVLQGTVEGTAMNYCINPEKWLEIKNMFNQFFDKNIACNGEDCC